VSSLHEGRECVLKTAALRVQLKLLKYLLQIGCKSKKEEDLLIIQAFCQSSAPNIEIPYEKGTRVIIELAKGGVHFI
jgi:hypothetical protein